MWYNNTIDLEDMGHGPCSVWEFLSHTEHVVSPRRPTPHPRPRADETKEESNEKTNVKCSLRHGTLSGSSSYDGIGRWATILKNSMWAIQILLRSYQKITLST